MEKIDGLDLGAIAAQAELEILAEKKAQVAALITRILRDIELWAKQAERLQRDADRLRQKVTQGMEKINKLRAGDWSVIKFPEQDKPASESISGVAQ